MDEDVLHADGGEDVAIVLAHALGEARLEGREDEIGAAVDDQLTQLVHAHDAVDFDDIHRLGLDLLDEEGLEVCGRAAVDLEADDAAAAALFQQDLEFADKVFGLFLDLDVAVADDAQHAAALRDAVREQRIEEERDDVFERDEAAAVGRGRQLDEAFDMGRDRHERAQAQAIGLAVQREADGEALVRQERERVRRIDGERRQDREDALEEAGAQPVAIGTAEFVGIDDGETHAASSRWRIDVQMRCCSAIRRPASAAMRCSCCCGVRPSVLVRVMPVRACWRRPATRTE